MESLAGILAGARGNPYQQTSQGIAPLLTQYLMNRQLAQGQPGQGAQGQAGQEQLATMPQPGQGMPLGLGMLSDNPQVAALIQALQAGQGSSQ